MKNVTQGDKRILVVGGQIMAASLRLPAENSWLCNVAQGGTSVTAQLETEEEAIIKTISPRLEAEGIFIFGADTLVDDDGKRILSEVNTLSIGGFPQAEKQTGRPIVRETINKIVNHKELIPFFEAASQVFNEQNIIKKDTKNSKPDRVVIKDNLAYLLDYKTGEKNNKHKAQIEEYELALQEMNYTVAKKVIIYIGESIEIVTL